jgi:transposase
MVREKTYGGIQGYRQMGHPLRRCARTVGLDRKTVRKYWNMTPGQYPKTLAEGGTREKVLDPYQEEMTVEPGTYPDITSAIIYGHLRGRHGGFSPSHRGVRLYITALREEPGIPTEVKVGQCTGVPEQPPGFQPQVYVGQKAVNDPPGKEAGIYIPAMAMSLSRRESTYFRDHPFDAPEFVAAHGLAFRYYGGGTDEIAYGQDRVMPVSGNAGT